MRGVAIRTAGESVTVSLSSLKRNIKDEGGNDLCAILAYGIGADEHDRLAGLPLTASSTTPVTCGLRKNEEVRWRY